MSIPRRKLLAVLAVPPAALVGLKVVRRLRHAVLNARSFQLFGGLTWRVRTRQRLVALTFDDGPTPDDLDAVLAGMHGAPGTFFVLGNRMADFPEGARRLVEAGHELGNHTWSHPRMHGVDQATVAAEIESTDAMIRAAGHQGEILVRPPYGQKLVVFPWWLRRNGRHTVMWDVSAETWDGTEQDADTLVRGTLQQVRPGSIILFHPWDGRTAVQQAVPRVVDELRRRGYTLVTVSQLLAQTGRR